LDFKPPIQPNGSRPPFFCVHGIDGEVIGYAALARSLGGDQPVYGLAGWATDEEDPGETRIETMAARYIQAIQTIQPVGPYYLGGYSYGGTVAFEMARQLHAQGQAVGLLAMFDHPAPKAGYEVPHYDLAFVRGFLNNLPHWLLDFIQITPQERSGRIQRKLLARTRIHASEELKLHRYLDDVHRFPQEFHERIRKHLLAWEAYWPQPYTGRVTLFRARRQPLLCSYDPHLAWDVLAQGGVNVYQVAGAHRNLMQEPFVQEVARGLKVALAHTSVY
jgi:thioesterase domain-containing protein